jgi:Calcineurin-like phosphoesterase
MPAPSPKPANPSAHPPCVEHGIWTPIPRYPPDDADSIKLKEIDPDESRSVKQRGVMSFHTIGCSGDFGNHVPGLEVAKAMAAQVADPHAGGGSASAVPASFLFHLGDVVYKDEDPSDPNAKDQSSMYNSQFYTQYTSYRRQIFAIAGNHDAKSSADQKKSAIDHFLRNFCAESRTKSHDNRTDKRLAMAQPYPYCLLETAVAHIISLATNDINGGQLDDPMGTKNTQYQWLVRTLKDLKQAADDKVIFLALHYPPYSGAQNFAERGDPNLGPTPRRPAPAGVLQPLGNILQQAFRESGQYPDVVLSAHAHHYQRLTYTYVQGWQIPFLVAGCGGHAPIEKLSKTCSGRTVPVPRLPFDAVQPPGIAVPKGDSVKVVAYNDDDFGFLRITADANKKIVIGEFFSAYNESNPKAPMPKLSDSFTLHLEKHTVR